MYNRIECSDRQAVRTPPPPPTTLLYHIKGGQGVNLTLLREHSLHLCLSILKVSISGCGKEDRGGASSKMCSVVHHNHLFLSSFITSSKMILPPHSPPLKCAVSRDWRFFLVKATITLAQFFIIPHKATLQKGPR
jgi:hypothetical protein